MRGARVRRGQFTVISAGLVAIVLLSAVIATYALVRNLPFQGIPGTSSTINEMNSALQGILEATVGYYGSILQVSGNTTFAKEQASNYVQSGLIQIARTHPQWNPSVQFSSFSITTNWFGTTSYSQATLTAKYSITSIGLRDFTVTVSASLKASIQSASNSTVRIQVLHENDQAELGLTASNFRFMTYTYGNSSWNTKVSVGTPRIFANGSYDVTLPSGVDPTSFLVQVTDPRGIMIIASKLNAYTYSFSWDALYSTLTQDTMMIELLQNGTMRWAGQNLVMSPQGRAIPPIPVRALRVNETISGVNQQVPFQVEDWGSSYRVAVGMSSPHTIFGPRSMLVFLVTHRVSVVTIWWDGRDIANQTSYASTNLYFTGDNPAIGRLTNGLLTLQVGGPFTITATSGSSSTTASFMRINGENSVYGASPAYVIYRGIVRDILQQEAEWSTGAPGAPNIYSTITILFPANATYYVYSLRAIFVASTQSRTLTDLGMLRLTVNTGSRQTENGTSAGLPIVSTALGDFWDQSWGGFPSGWMHHWSQYITGSSGGGVMMTDQQNRNLYAFDPIASARTGAIHTDSTGPSGRAIELDPVRRFSASFTNALDYMLIGAVVTFNTTPIYPTSGTIGLWIMAERPPVITVS